MASTLASRIRLLAACGLAAPFLFASVANAQAVRFTSSSNTIKVMGETSLGTHYTIEALVMREQIDFFGGGRLFSEQLNTQEDKWLSVHDSGYSASVWSNTCFPNGLTMDGPLPSNAWRHIAFVRNGNTLTYYVNGQQVASTTTTCPGLNGTGGNMAFGAFTDTGSTSVRSSFIGRMDWFRVSSTARYTAPFQSPQCEPDSDADTVMLFKFNDAPGTTSPVDSGPSHFAAAVATGFTNATSPTFGFAGASTTGGTAVLSKAADAVCADAGAQFSVAAPINSTGYQWQLETSPGQWLSIGNDPAPLPCGGNATFATAQPANSASVAIGIHGCPGPFNVRCLVTTPCGVVTSNTAQVFVRPADIGRQGGLTGSDGLYDNNDFIAFINCFFDNLPAADLGKQGGLLGTDGMFDNNDFISFINLFFDEC